jgi:hypothetical protein
MFHSSLPNCKKHLSGIWIKSQSWTIKSPFRETTFFQWIKIAFYFIRWDLWFEWKSSSMFWFESMSYFWEKNFFEKKNICTGKNEALLDQVCKTIFKISSKPIITRFYYKSFRKIYVDSKGVKVFLKNLQINHFLTVSKCTLKKGCMIWYELSKSSKRKKLSKVDHRKVFCIFRSLELLKINTKT